MTIGTPMMPRVLYAQMWRLKDGPARAWHPLHPLADGIPCMWLAEPDLQRADPRYEVRVVRYALEPMMSELAGDDDALLGRIAAVLARCTCMCKHVKEAKALLAARQPQTERFVEFAAKFGEPPVSFLAASSATPPAPQRFWRVVHSGDETDRWSLEVVDVHGSLLERPSFYPWDSKSDAIADGMALAMPEWPGGE